MLSLHREKERRFIIWGVYILGFILVTIFLLKTDTFLLEPVAKMYFPNYYVPGSLHWLMRVIFQIILPVYFVYEMILAYKKNTDNKERNRILYFAVGFAGAWFLGFIPIPLIFDYQVDPMWGLFFPIAFAIPFTYAVLKYELMDIRVIAKRAFIYALAVVGVGLIIALFDFSSQLIQTIYPGFPIWIAPLFIAVLIVTIAVAIWGQLRESDVLKYEFITTVTHKFRTPLTHIKWAAENIKETSQTKEEIAEQIGYIEGANAKLVELTDLLSTASDSDENGYNYHLERGDFSAFANEIVQTAIDHLDAKKIPVFKEIPEGIFAIFDAARLRFVLQTLVENAINYTPDGSPMTVSVKKEGRHVICSVKDSGIGIPKNELPYIFTKLYRGKRARAVDTEGMGIGLFITKAILARHHGKIWVESDGENLGSTFTFCISAAK